MSMFQVPDFGVADEDEQPVNQTLPVVAAKIGIPSPADWGALAFALILLPNAEDVERSCADYNTSPEIVDAMLGGPNHPAVPHPIQGFMNALREAKRQITALGTDAGFVLRARTVSEGHLGLIDEIARNPHTPPQYRLKAIELGSRLSLLNPDAKGRGSESDKAPAVGVMVNISMGAGLPVPQGLTINAIPTTPPEDL